MSTFVEFLFDGGVEIEPVTITEVKQHARIEIDMAEDDDYIASILIPSARQQAEVRTGSAIVEARYKQHVKGLFGSSPVTITHGNVLAVESISYKPLNGGANVFIDIANFEAVNEDRETVVYPAGLWPQVGTGARAVEITYTAGLSRTMLTAKYPSVRNWILMAAAWGYAQRELFMSSGRGQGFQELPADYMQSMLDPLCVPPRF